MWKREEEAKETRTIASSCPLLLLIVLYANSGIYGISGWGVNSTVTSEKTKTSQKNLKVIWFLWFRILTQSNKYAKVLWPNIPSHPCKNFSDFILQFFVWEWNFRNVFIFHYCPSSKSLFRVVWFIMFRFCHNMRWNSFPFPHSFASREQQHERVEKAAEKGTS